MPSAHARSLPRKIGAAVGALASLAIEPRLEFASALTDALCLDCMTDLAAGLALYGAGRRLLAERPQIDSKHVDFAALAALPDGTLGREYVRLLADYGITPDSFRPPPGYGELPGYVTMRLRQTHDLWHLLTGYPPDPCGEILISAFIYGQVGAPSSLLLALLGPLRYGLGRHGLLGEVRAAYRRGKATPPLATVFWEELWAEPLAAVRERVGCPAA
jgi:ubiquinone biosynthesis protein COQ4